MKKKILSILVGLVLIVGLTPTMALAAGGTACQQGDACTTHEAAIGSTHYDTLQEALEAGGNVRLLQNVEVHAVITVDKPTVLDLGDYTITNKVEAESPLHVDAESFTVNAGSGGMVIPQDNTSSKGFIEVISASSFTLNGGTYSGNTDSGAFFRLHSGASGAEVKINNVTATTNFEVFNRADTLDTIHVTVSGGSYRVGSRAFMFDVYDCENSPIIFDGVTITADRGPCVDLSGGNSVFSDCNFTVTGNFTGGHPWSRAAIGVAYEGKVTVKSGTYTAQGASMGQNEGYGVYIYTSGGTLHIEGGTFAGTTASLRADVDKNTYGNPSTIHVLDGNFDGDILAPTETGLESIVITDGKFTGITDKTLAQGNNLSVFGGTFDNSVKDFVSNDLEFEHNSNGTYTYHETLQDAMKDVTSNTTISAVHNPAAGGSAYKATLVFNDESGRTIELVADAGGKITLPSIGRGGYIFLGWDDGSDAPIAANQDYTLTEDKTLTGVWKVLTKIKTAAKAATCTQNGNIEYWYCPELQSYFSDEALTKKIALKDTVIAAAHGKTALRNAKEATCIEEGYTGDIVCQICGDVLEQGTIIARKEHTYQEGKCILCGTADPSAKPVEPTPPSGTDAPKTGDSSMLLWCLLLLISGLGVAGTALYRKKTAK
nr:InlB B-repeat-containing protein [Maliibacterium massiliense]